MILVQYKPMLEESVWQNKFLLFLIDLYNTVLIYLDKGTG